MGYTSRLRPSMLPMPGTRGLDQTMQSATANQTGAAQVGRTPGQPDTATLAEPGEEVVEGRVAQLKDLMAEKREQVQVFWENSQIAGLQSAQDPLRTAWYIEDAVHRSPTGESRAANLAAGAVMLLITLMIVLLAALVGGKFAAAVPSDSVFSNAITTTTDNAGTAFVIFGVSLLAIPTVSVLAYVVTKLGPFIGFGGMGGGAGGGMMRRR